MPDAGGAAIAGGPAATFTLKGVRDGFVEGQALAVGVAVYGTAFGALAAQVAMPVEHALGMSVLVYSGSAQLVALRVLGEGATLLALATAILVVNARYLLYGAALRPWMGRLPWWQSYGTLYFLGDGGWALSMRRHAAGLADAGHVLGCGIATFVPWVGGTLAGRLAGGLVADPAALGFDFLLVAFSTTLLVGGWSGRRSWAPAIAATLTALALDRLGHGGWAVVGAGVVGAAVAFLDGRTA